MPDFVVSTAFTGKDKVSKMFDKMGRSAGKFGKKTDLAFQRAGRSGTKFGTIVKGILAAGAIQRGAALLEQGIVSVTGSFIEFDDAATAASVRFKDIGPDAKNFNEQMKAIKESARAAGAATEFTATQSAQALDFLARAGFTSAEAMGSLNSMINLATATGEDFAMVADMSSDLLGAFGLSSNNAAQKIKNLTRLNDVLVKTTNSANVTVENMFETMKSVGPVSGILGASLEEVSALTAVLGNSGIKGSDAMTALKNAYLRLAAPVGAGADILKDLNITLDDGTGDAKKMTDLMEELGGKLKGLGEVKQAEVLDAIFGKRAIAGGKNILDNIGNIRAFEKTLLDAAGTSQKTADIMRQSLGNRLKTLGSAATELGFKFLEAFQVRGKNGIEAITEAIRKFDVKPIIAGIEGVIRVTRGMINAIKPFIPVLKVLAGGMLAYNIALKAQIALGAIKHFFAFIKVIQAAAGAQGLLNVVMAANPIGAVITGITLLIAAGVLLVRNWDTIKTTFITAFDWVKKFFAKSLSGFLNLISQIIGAVSKLGSAIGIDTSGFDNILSKIEETQNKLSGELQVKTTAPNAAEVEGRRQNVDFKGRIDILGASHGSTATSKTTGAPDIDFNMLGSDFGI